MSDIQSPVASPAGDDPPVNDGQEKEPEEDMAAVYSDKESDILSEVDEDQLEDYDPETANIEDRPVDIDEDVARTLKVSKRKRIEAQPKKPREGRREKKRRDRDDDVTMEDGSDGDQERKPRRRRAAAEGERAPRAARAKQTSPEPENEDHLSPEERRKRAIDRALDAAIKKGGSSSTRRRKKDEIDLEDEIDEQLADLKVQMERACLADNEARRVGQPALHKLKLLPQVNAILNRNNVQHAVLDPDTNFLLHVKYFMEPLSDGSLPAYNIQRDLFTALTKLNIEKESLRSSGIGKIVLFYTKSKKPEPSIKRMAERLLGEWSRPILKRTDDYKKRHVETREFDYHAAKLQQRQKAGSQFNLTQRPAQSAAEVERERMLAPTRLNNEARMASLPSSYTIAPMSTFDGNRANDHRPLGASGMEAFRKMTQKGKKRG
ncbi:transcription factor IWS1 [Cordyceps militaris CM01]|uniref:Transcription factor IWS1 n=2 Tax=Cordyceps militaris TaxID=73501 RepID=G3JPL0_CORMM|nr:transcription factor IWS1 [Cordyceps militaris CM01]ATY67106.1 transcription factor IWS1 [Cordyceps militaris]EGX89059.1 transcription factor IWS1 [Cordyceps militaris CM01]